MATDKADPIALCSWKGCNKPASHRYRWSWGEENTVCSACIPLMQQTRENLQSGGTGPTLSLNALDQTSAPDVTVHERTQLIAGKLSAEAELAEVQKRGHQLYNSNVDLTQQVQTLTMKAREHETHVVEKDEQIERLAERLEQRERENASMSQELQRLRTLVQFAEPDRNVVGGAKSTPPQGKAAKQPPAGG